MNTTTMKLKEIKLNPSNPRVIKDNKFQQLVKSIQDFPEMLSLRPIVVNEDKVVLGGNMRLRACQDAGLKEVPVIVANELTFEQQRQFIIKDNIGYGEWDWELLANEWNLEELGEWGLDVVSQQDWDNLQDIGEVDKPLTRDNIIKVVVPDELLTEKSDIEALILEAVQQKYAGCAIQ